MDAGSTEKTLRSRSKGQSGQDEQMRVDGSGTILRHEDSVSETDTGSGSTPDSIRGFLCNSKCVLIQQLQWIDCNGFE